MIFVGVIVVPQLYLFGAVESAQCQTNLPIDLYLLDEPIRKNASILLTHLQNPHHRGYRWCDFWFSTVFGWGRMAVNAKII